jgi:hypothetical protein
VPGSNRVSDCDAGKSQHQWPIFAVHPTRWPPGIFRAITGLFTWAIWADSPDQTLAFCADSESVYIEGGALKVWGLLWGLRIHAGPSPHISVELATTIKLAETKGVAGLSAFFPTS